MRHAAILFCLLLAGCHTAPVKPAPKSTQALTRNLDSANGSLTDADASAGRAQVHVSSAKTLAGRLDAKASVIQSWLERQESK